MVKFDSFKEANTDDYYFFRVKGFSALFSDNRVNYVNLSLIVDKS